MVDATPTIFDKQKEIIAWFALYNDIYVIIVG